MTAPQKQQKQAKRSNLPLILTAVILVCVASVVVFLNIGSDKKSDENAVQVVNAGDKLVIPVEEVTETAAFYPLEVDGTSMEVLAIRDSAGTVRTAFNTCQSCFTSGRGYYEQQDGYLVCQNCGNRFTAEQVEVQAGGCNPWPIFAENKTVTEDSIEIAYDYLKEATVIFQKWKV